MSLISLLILLIVFAVVYWIVSLIPMPPTFRTIIYVVLGLFLLIYLLQSLGVVGPVIRLSQQQHPATAATRAILPDHSGTYEGDGLLFRRVNSRLFQIEFSLLEYDCAERPGMHGTRDMVCTKREHPIYIEGYRGHEGVAGPPGKTQTLRQAP